jgi:hypothetical protein
VGFAGTGVDHARRAGDRHVLGLALTQIAQIAVADDDPAAAASAASEALDLQERIGYTEGIVSALHVVGTAARLSGELDAARRHHRRALGLASRIGHGAAMCEAVEDLARDEVVDRPDVAVMLLRAARAERDRRGLPLRQRDRQELADLERALAPTTSLAGQDRAFSDLVAEIAE